MGSFNVTASFENCLNPTSQSYPQMTSLLRAFCTCVGRTRFERSAVANFVSSESLPRLVEGARSRSSPAVKSVEANVALVSTHAADIAQDNPWALAHMVAYFREMQSLNDLLYQHGVGASTASSGDLTKAAGLVGLRLPSVNGSKAPRPSEAAEGKR